MYANQARERTEQAAEDHAELLRHVLDLVRQAQDAAPHDPELADKLLSYAQRDIALSIAALTDIRAWMVDAKRGKAD